MIRRLALIGLLWLPRPVRSEDVPPPATRTYQVARVSYRPAIDGNLKDGCWTPERFTSDFRMASAATPVSGQTRVACCYDDRYLFAAFDVDDSRGSKPPGTAEWASECVYVDLASPEEHTVATFSVHRNGRINVRFNGRLWSDVEFERLSIKASASEREGGYSAELQIPLCLLAGRDCQDDLWRVNFRRGVQQPQVQEEMNIWTGTVNSFLVSEAGLLRGFAPDWKAFGASGKITALGRSARVEFESHSPTDLQAEGTVSVVHGGREMLSKSEPLAIQAGKPGRMEVEFGRGLDPVTVYARLEDNAGPLWVTQPVTYSPPKAFSCRLAEPAYRNSIYSSQPDKRILVEWQLAPDAGELSQGAVYIELLDGSGKALARESVPIPACRFTLDVSGFPAGEYSLLVLPRMAKMEARFLDQATMRVFPIRILKPAKQEVYLNGDGVLMVNGQPMFAMGIYWFGEYALTDFVNPANRRLGLPEVTLGEVADALRDRHFNWGVGWSASQELLSAAGRSGIHPMTRIDGLFHGGQIDDIRSVMTNDEILAWYTWDEMEGPVLEAAKGVYRVMCRIDPYHPIGTAINSPQRYVEATEALDIVMPDIYPLKGNMHYRTGAILPRVYEETRQAVTSLPPGKTVWGVPQAFGVDNYWKMPTAQEYRNMCYQFLAAGARGLAAYSYCSSETYGDRHYWMPATPLWDQIGPINEEIRRLSFLWTAPGGTYGLTDDGKVALMERSTDSGPVCLAVNRSYDPAEILLDAPDGTSATEEVLSGSLVQGGRIRDRIESLGVRVYRYRVE